MSLQKTKSSLIKTLDSKRPGEAEGLLDRLVPLLKVSPEAGTFMLTGSDFLDSLSAAYAQASDSLRRKLVTTAHLGLAALLQGQKPNYSLLSDHLYSLKTGANKDFVADLVTNTSLLRKIRDGATSPEANRLKNTAASLSEFERPSIARPKKLVRRKVDKGKGKAQDDEYGHGAFSGEVHVHRMSLITQVQDLFPDLGSGFVVKLLDEYNDNVEEVISHLLEDSLPAHLAKADRSEKLPTSPAVQRPHLTPRSTPPPPESEYVRRNVFDNNELDRLAVDTSRLHIGRKGKDLTADKILSDRSQAPNKSHILAALAAFDSDDDERDDTYDAEDVGGLVDSTLAETDDAAADKNEEALFRAYSASPEVFGRDAETRRGKARSALKSETGMTDEAIEGWGIMIGRDPKRLRRLEARFSAFSGQQTELPPTAYRGSPAESGEESGHGQRGGRGGGRGRGRGRGRGGGGRGGGNVAGPSDDKQTQVSRQRKEANKGSRANHNRRDQRARKMARGGMPT
jgi:activating signal cointegrator complex subunit 2